MALTADQYTEAVQARKALRVAAIPNAAASGMKSLTDAGWDGDYVAPNQLSSCAFDGPVLVLNNWFGWQELDALPAETKLRLRSLGYLEGISTNKWIDRALEIVGLKRSQVYITQACVFLPPSAMGSSIPRLCYAYSIHQVLRLELGGRTPVALGTAAQRACLEADIEFVGTQHPSYQGGERRAQEIASAIRRVM